MKLIVLALVCVAALVAGRPENVLLLDLDDIHHDMSIDSLEDDIAITGEYRWTSPKGKEFFVRYVANDNGYRVIESNAVPVTDNGVKADGRQVFFSSEENSFENRS